MTEPRDDDPTTEPGDETAVAEESPAVDAAVPVADDPVAIDPVSVDPVAIDPAVAEASVEDSPEVVAAPDGPAPRLQSHHTEMTDRDANLILARAHLRLGSLGIARAKLETMAGRN